MKTMHILLASAALTLLSLPALADTNVGGGCTGNCSGDGTGGATTINNTVSPTISPTIKSNNYNINQPSNTNTNTNNNAVTVSPTITNTNNNNSSAAANAASNAASNATANAQGGAGGNASSNSGGNTQSVNFRDPHQVGAIAVSIAASGVCTGQATAVSGGFTMFSIGVSHISVDPECAKREAFRLGISSDDPEIRELARKVFLSLDAVKDVMK